jgi:YgiT-type zinc finger domain-containing protein
MNSDAHDCCCAGKMREGKHDFMARVGNEIVVIKDVPSLICDTCGEVEYTLEVSREIDVIIKEFFAGWLLAKPLAAGGDRIQAPAGRFDGVSMDYSGSNGTHVEHFGFHDFSFAIYD